MRMPGSLRQERAARVHELASYRKDQGVVIGNGPKVKLVPVRVTLLLDTFTVEGNVYVSPELRRFSDAWESVMRDHRTYIPVTGATIVRVGEDGEFASPNFMQVKKSDLRAVYPSTLPENAP
jgi:hypothetical protein